MAWYWAIMGVSAGSDMGEEWMPDLEESRREVFSDQSGVGECGVWLENPVRVGDAPNFRLDVPSRRGLPAASSG
jgi:hypothetical protein